MGDKFYKAVRLDKTSHYDCTTRWRKGSIVRPDRFDNISTNPCGYGIHCSRNLLDAVKYQRTSSLYCEVELRGRKIEGDDKVRCESVKVLKWLSKEEQDEIAGFKLWEANHPFNPLKHKPDQINFEKNLSVWSSVGSSVWSSVWDSVWDSVGSSVRSSVRSSVWDSVGSSVRSSVGSSVWDSVGSSVGSSVWDSVGSSVWDSVWDSVWAYTGGLFPEIKSWKYIEDLSDPWRPLLTLWYAGYVPSFDGKTWRLHAGKKAKIVYESTQK